MCRLFGLHAGSPVRATFWLLSAPDSLLSQSHREPDGTGIGVFTPTGAPVIHKRPMAAWQDREFATQARDLTSRVFLAHVRYASTGGLNMANTHPFAQHGRIFAHNGAISDLDQVDQRLVALGAADLVLGDTDSERIFALITAEISAHHGDIEGGLIAALTWIAGTVGVYCLNLILATPQQLWALRYPDTHQLWVLQRAVSGRGPLDVRSCRIRASSESLADGDATIIASEPMDDDPRWRLLTPGELIRVDAGQQLTSSHPLPPDLRLPLTRNDVAAGKHSPARDQ